jgi:transglutaminase-like putative cysteine protease
MRMLRKLLAALFAIVLVSIAIAAQTQDPWKTVAGYEFEYRVPLSMVGEPGSTVSLWVPYPAENNDQRVLKATVESPWPWSLNREPKFGNRMIYTEGKVDPGTSDLLLRVQVERRPSRGIGAAEAAADASLSPALYRGSDRMVPLAGLIQEIAAKESEGLATEPEKVQAFYDYVYRTMTYNKDGTGWGRGDAVWACTNKRGNCTDFHSLFIGMLRSQGIPARFLIGFPIPDGAEGEIGGYHCWAEFYDAAKGWLPVDASEAKKKGLKEAYFGSLPNDRIEFTVGRDVMLAPPQKSDPVNYFIYPYAEVGGKPLPDLKGTFRFRRLEPAVSS